MGKAVYQEVEDYMKGFHRGCLTREWREEAREVTKNIIKRRELEEADKINLVEGLISLERENTYREYTEKVFHTAFQRELEKHHYDVFRPGGYIHPLIEHLDKFPKKEEEEYVWNIQGKKSSCKVKFEKMVEENNKKAVKQEGVFKHLAGHEKVEFKKVPLPLDAFDTRSEEIEEVGVPSKKEVFKEFTKYPSNYTGQYQEELDKRTARFERLQEIKKSIREDKPGTLAEQMTKFGEAYHEVMLFMELLLKDYTDSELEKEMQKTPVYNPSNAVLINIDDEIWDIPQHEWDRFTKRITETYKSKK